MNKIPIGVSLVDLKKQVRKREPEQPSRHFLSTFLARITVQEPVDWGGVVKRSTLIGISILTALRPADVWELVASSAFIIRHTLAASLESNFSPIWLLAGATQLSVILWLDNQRRKRSKAASTKIQEIEKDDAATSTKGIDHGQPEANQPPSTDQQPSGSPIEVEWLNPPPDLDLRNQLRNCLRTSKSSVEKLDELLDEIVQRYEIRPLVYELAQVLDTFKPVKRQSKKEILSQIETLTERLNNTLVDLGITVISPKPGDSFDPRKHQPISTQTTSDPSSVGCISEVFQSGLQTQTQLIRQARIALFTKERNTQ